MTTGDLRKLYREAWNRLFEVVKLRNKLLRRLDVMATPAISITLATGMLIEFDTDQARALLAEIDRLTPRLKAGVEEVNQYAGRTGSPVVKWQAPHLDFDF